MASKDRRTCVFCGGPANSVEHIFKRTFKKKLGIADEPRVYTYEDHGAAPISPPRPDPLFEAKVRRVCGDCNSGWMNDLDLSVEGWILDPTDEKAYHDCDPSTF